MKVGITTDFLIRQDYIASNFCENKDKPELHCNGKCVLMKKLNLTKDSDKEPKQLPEISRIEVSSFLLQDVQSELDQFILKIKDSLNIGYINQFKSAILVYDIFNPPKNILS